LARAASSLLACLAASLSAFFSALELVVMLCPPVCRGTGSPRG
jgi:hypothetical protein